MGLTHAQAGSFPMLEISLLGTLRSEKVKIRRIEAGCIATLKKSNDIGRIENRTGNPPSCRTDSVAFLINSVKKLNPGLGSQLCMHTEEL
jgi:hypothetical protein